MSHEQEGGLGTACFHRVGNDILGERRITSVNMRKVTGGTTRVMGSLKALQERGGPAVAL